MRLDRFLSSMKYGSRKEVKKYIKDQQIKVNGVICRDEDRQINPECDTITFKDEAVFYVSNLILAIYKPVGFLSANHDKKYQVVFDLIKEPFNRFDLKIAGRLDLDSEGLMILTTDGNLIHQLTHPHHHVDKVYEVTLNKPLSSDDKEKLLTGVSFKNTNDQMHDAQAKALIADAYRVIITIDEGKFHQVKKMFDAVGYRVLTLKRIRYGKLKLDLQEGQYRQIEKSELI